MNQKITGRLLSIFLCAVMLVSMLPAVSAAAVSSVEITGVTAPALGAAPATGASVPADSGYTVESVLWVGWQNGQSEGSAAAVSTFAGGWYYQVRITLAAGADTEFDSGLTATVNGSSQNVEVAVSSGASATVKRTFYVEPEVTDTPISSVAVSGITAPAAGESPDFTASAGDSTYAVYQVVWYNTDSPAMLTQTDKFMPGVRYQVQIILEAASGHSFASSVSATLNGNATICGTVPGKDAAKYVSVLQEYTVSSENLITEVEVSDLSAPVKGATADMSVTVASSAPYLVDSVSWKKWKTGTDSSAAVSMSSQEKFLTGYEYRVYIVLRAKTDYAFATNGTEPAVTGTVNGASAQSAVSVAGKNAAQYVCICFDYALDVNLIRTVTITNVIEPFAGEAPSNRTRVSLDEPYTVSMVYWEMCDVALTPGEFTQMNATTIFAGGMAYRVNIVLEAKDGAEFAVGEDREPDVTGTINGAAARPAEIYAGKDPAQTICISYEFPALTDYIQYVEVYKIDEPQAGKYPDTDGVVPKDVLYSVDQITWEQWNKTTAEFEKMSNYTAFEENQDYRVVIRLRAKTGGAFYVNQFGELQVTAAINGTPTIPAEAVQNLDPLEYVAISYDYSLSSDAKVIRQVNVHDLEIPRAGETPDFQVNTDAVAKYTVDAVIWEQMQNRRSSNAKELLTEESVFQEGEYYRVQIILKAGEDTVFHTNAAGKPQVTAVLNNGTGIAAENVSGKDAAEYICISYTYGVYSVIEGGDAQWSPEKGTLRFRFTGDFENFTGVRVDGKLLNERLYTAASGSTIITLQESFLNSLQDGIYELTVLYTDGQVSTKFQVSGSEHSEGNKTLKISPWVWLLPPLAGVIAALFFAVFIVKKRAESRVHKEEYEEYYEDEEDDEDYE